MTLVQTVRAKLVDMVESVGGLVEVVPTPVSPESRLKYPKVTVVLAKATFVTHRATLGLAYDDVARWLADRVEE